MALCDELLADARFALNEYAGRRLCNGFDTLQHPSQRLTGSNNTAEIQGDADFLAQVVAFILQFLAQTGVLRQSASQLSFGAISLSNIF